MICRRSRICILHGMQSAQRKAAGEARRVLCARHVKGEVKMRGLVKYLMARMICDRGRCSVGGGRVWPLNPSRPTP